MRTIRLRRTHPPFLVQRSMRFSDSFFADLSIEFVTVVVRFTRALDAPPPHRPENLAHPIRFSLWSDPFNTSKLISPPNSFNFRDSDFLLFPLFFFNLCPSILRPACKESCFWHPMFFCRSV